MLTSNHVAAFGPLIRVIFGMIVTFGLAGQSVFALPQVDSTPVKTSTSVVKGPAVLKVLDSVKIPAERPGVLLEVKVREGELVRKGDLVARINADDHELRLQRTKIDDQIARLSAENDVDIRYAEKSLEVAKAELQRSYDSNDRITNSVPLARIEQQQLVVHRNLLQLEQAQRDHRVAQMKVGLVKKDIELSAMMVEKANIYAPMDGMVVAVESKPGEWVEPGQTILKIVRLDRLKLDGFVSTEDASRIRIGDPVIATMNQPGLSAEEFSGEVIFKNPEANPVNATVQIWVEIKNSEMKLIAGLAAEMLIKPSGH